MEDYEAPKLPTLEESKPELLKKVPLRWKRKAMAAAVGLGLLGTIPLSGCDFHFGGAGGGPIYVAHFTEYDAMNIIQTRLEEHGLNFDSDVPWHYIDLTNWTQLGLSLYDAQNSVAIAFINFNSDTTSEAFDARADQMDGSRLVEHALNEFRNINGDTIYGVFYNPYVARDLSEREDGLPHTAEEIELLTESLEVQIQEFIEYLQNEGIIE